MNKWARLLKGNNLGNRKKEATEQYWLFALQMRPNGTHFVDGNFYSLFNQLYYIFGIPSFDYACRQRKQKKGNFFGAQFSLR